MFRVLRAAQGSEVNSAWLITSQLANQRAPKALFTCIVYTNINDARGVHLTGFFSTLHQMYLISFFCQHFAKNTPVYL